VFAALSAGLIDLARARVFSEVLLEVDDAVATSLVDKLIDRAGEWTCGQLRERLRYYLHKADPGWVSRRYKVAVAGREVRTWTNPDGTACIFGKDLPVDRAAAADDYLTRLARAAKAAGDVRTLAQLRADAYLDLLSGNALCTQPSCDPVTTQSDADSRAWAETLRHRWPVGWPTGPVKGASTVDDPPDDDEDEQLVPASFVHDPTDSIGLASLAADWAFGAAEPTMRGPGTMSRPGEPRNTAGGQRSSRCAGTATRRRTPFRR
jgi:hypothetical protein